MPQTYQNTPNKSALPMLILLDKQPRLLYTVSMMQEANNAGGSKMVDYHAAARKAVETRRRNQQARIGTARDQVRHDPAVALSGSDRQAKAWKCLEYLRRRQKEKAQQASQRATEHEEILTRNGAILETGKCPQCGAELVRNSALTGWYQCACYGNADRRKPECRDRPDCSFQMFVDNGGGQ
jgi:hypothetical protein